MLITEFYVVGIHSNIVYIKIEEHKCNHTKIIRKHFGGIILYN